MVTENISVYKTWDRDNTRRWFESACWFWTVSATDKTDTDWLVKKLPVKTSQSSVFFAWFAQNEKGESQEWIETAFLYPTYQVSLSRGRDAPCKPHPPQEVERKEDFVPLVFCIKSLENFLKWNWGGKPLVVKKRMDKEKRIKETVVPAT